MFPHEHERSIERLEKEFEREILEFEQLFRRKYRRRHGGGEKLLFEFEFNNVKILQPMNVTKRIGAFTGSLVFKDAEGDILDISKGTNLSLAVNDSTIGNATLDTTTGKFSGSGLIAGDLILTASVTNDAGNVVTGTTTITFSADTTITEVDVNVD